MRHTEIAPGFGFIILSGEIMKSDSVEFSRIADFYKMAAVLFRSPGGDLRAGLEIGETIRLRKFSAGVAPGTVCASACALAWLGGTERYMSQTSLIGFHASYYVAPNGEAAVSAIGNALIGRYLTRLGLPVPVIEYATRADPHELELLTPEAAKAIGLELTVLELSPGATQIAPTGTAKKQTHYVSGLDPDGDNWLAFKAGPSMQAKRLRKLPPNTPLTLLESKEPWLKVKLEDGSIGWVYKKYVSCCR